MPCAVADSLSVKLERVVLRVLHHPGRDLRPGGHAELGEDVTDVAGDRGAADEEAGCDGRVAESFRYELGDLERFAASFAAAIAPNHVSTIPAQGPRASSEASDMATTWRTATSAPRVVHRSMDVDGLRIFYREAVPADAPTMLLLHGFSSATHQFRRLIDALGGDDRLIAAAYPGFGFSDAPQSATTLACARRRRRLVVHDDDRAARPRRGRDGGRDAGVTGSHRQLGFRRRGRQGRRLAQHAPGALTICVVVDVVRRAPYLRRRALEPAWRSPWRFVRPMSPIWPPSPRATGSA